MLPLGLAPMVRHGCSIEGDGMSNSIIILSGGTGTRMNAALPKQYIEVDGKPVIEHTLNGVGLELFSHAVIVLSDNWKEFFMARVAPAFPGVPFMYAPAGDSRQESILNGLKALSPLSSEDDIVVIHDAARPMVRRRLVKELIEECKSADGAMPVLPISDTVYQSRNGVEITGLLKRDELYKGQSPEAFKFGKYFEINRRLSKEQLAAVFGSSEIAYRDGLRVTLIRGDEANFKITTPSDLESFKKTIEAIQ
jgi:2-C-methyl-D-erythritol 4-phosphate cytidylyltransferase